MGRWYVTYRPRPPARAPRVHILTAPDRQGAIAGTAADHGLVLDPRFPCGKPRWLISAVEVPKQGPDGRGRPKNGGRL